MNWWKEKKRRKRLLLQAEVDGWRTLVVLLHTGRGRGQTSLNPAHWPFNIQLPEDICDPFILIPNTVGQLPPATWVM